MNSSFKGIDPQIKSYDEKYMKTFVIGDIHGQYLALLACLKACRFNYVEDRLISLGDVCDRGPRVRECVDELLKIRDLVYLLGNHDAWALDWAVNGHRPKEWIEQGGAATIASYGGQSMPAEHIEFFTRAALYYEEKGRLFVHAGFDPKLGVEKTPREIFIWDRALANESDRLHKISPGHLFGGYDEVYVGHTPTLLFHERRPRQCCNLWMLDTGVGVGGLLTIMDVDTKQYWQS